MNMKYRHLRVGASPLAFAFGLAGACLGQGALAQSSVGTVTVTAPTQSAPYEAATTVPLEAIQPTSVLSAHFIQNNIAPSSNYDDIARISPSVSSVGPNGPGLMENQSLTIRGFQDGQFNVTLDGIFWGDSNDFTHHSTSYFTSHDLGAVVVDRGPGTASTLGNATFGGTVAMQTKDPLNTQTEEAYGSIGSFGSYLGGGEFDTGAIAALNGAKAIVDVSHLQSDGALTNMGINRTNVFTKVVAPVTANTTVTFVGMYNQLHQNVGLGATAAEYATLGYNYGLNNNPSSQAYTGYNFDEIHTDMEYVNVDSNLGDGWTFSDKVYTYAYVHRGFAGEDPNGQTPNGTAFGANDVPGTRLINDYRSYGNIAQLSKDLGFVELKTGFWYDHQWNSRQLFEVDFTQGGIINPGPPNFNAIDHIQTNTLDTFQPYFEADFKPIEGLDITPGVRYDSFRRAIDAPVNQSTLAPLNFAKTFAQVLPSIAIHYQVASQWSVYAQIAEGFLAPNVNEFYTTNPALSTTLKPESTMNYQVGGGYRSDRFTLSVDAYYIDFSNFVQAAPPVQGVVVFSNAGGVIYKGLEAEGDYRIWGPVSFYANASVNSALTKGTNIPIANSPRATAAAGLTYDAHNIYASLLAKYTGTRYGDANYAIPLPEYTTAQLSVGYTFPKTDNHPQIKVSGLIDNLFDYRGVNALAGYTLSTTASSIPATSIQNPNALFWNVVPRNYSLRVSAVF